MTTYNFTNGSIGGRATIQAPVEYGKTVVLNRIVDFSLQNLSCLSSADTANVLNIPAGTTVLTAYCKVLTGEASTVCNIGYGSTMTTWGSALATTTANAGVILGGTFAPKYFADADTIDVNGTTAGGAATLAAVKLEVFALCTRDSNKP